MREFILSAKVTISIYTKVEAETIEEAIEIAREERQMMSIVSSGGDAEDSNWMCDELDGEPYDVHDSEA